MAAIDFTWSSSDLDFWRGRATERALADALSKAGSGAARAMRVDASRRVRARKRLKVAFVNRSLSLSFPRKKDLSSLAWAMDVSGKLIPIAAYPHRQTKRGVSVSVNVGSRKLIPSAFIATMPTGHRGVFRRRGSKRLPIKETFSSRVRDVFADAEVVPGVFDRALEVFDRDFARLWALAVDRARK